MRKTQVTDLSAFKGREHILGIERKKLGIVKAVPAGGRFVVLPDPGLPVGEALPDALRVIERLGQGNLTRKG